MPQPRTSFRQFRRTPRPTQPKMRTTMVWPPCSGLEGSSFSPRREGVYRVGQKGARADGGGQNAKRRLCFVESLLRFFTAKRLHTTALPRSGYTPQPRVAQRTLGNRDRGWEPTLKGLDNGRSLV